MFAGTHFLAGSFLGLAGSLHCIGLCGGISPTLVIVASMNSKVRGPLLVSAEIQIGRVLSYVLLGAAVGGGGAAFSIVLDLSGLQIVFRVFAALALIWSGCSVAGLSRSIRVIDNAVIAVTGFLRSSLSNSFANRHPIAMGVVWGFAPCGMVYAALLNAMMTGTPVGGAELMLGFGLATIPMLTLATLSASLLCGLNASLRQAGVRRLLGGVIATIGILTLLEPKITLSSLCLGG